MSYESCPHGYIPSSCAECRERAAKTDQFGELFSRYNSLHEGGNRAGWRTRRTEITAELAKLEGYSRRSNAQDEQLHELTSELTVLGSLIDQDDVRIRSERLADVKRAYSDPANRESGYDLGPGAPAVVKGLGDRAETPGEVLQRMRSNPWRHERGILHRAETAEGMVSRAHTALEGLESRLTRDGCQKLADAMAEMSGWSGVTVKRSKQEQADA